MPFSSTRRVIVNLLEGTILVIMIIAAGYVSIGRILVADIGNFRLDIEKSLSERLDIAVHIGKISGGWKYLDPEISIENLVVGNTSRPAVHIGRAFARIDTLASLRERTIVMRNLEIAGLALTIVRNPEGKWQIQGMPRGQGKAKPFNAGPLLDSLDYLRGADISRVNINVKTGRGRYHVTNQPNKPLQLVQEGVQKTIYMPLSVTHSGNGGASRFELLGHYQGDPRQLAGFTANLYLRLPQIDISDFLPGKIAGLELGGISVGGQLWLDCNHGNIEIRSLPVIDRISIRHDGKPVNLVRDFTATLAAATWAPGEWQVHMADIETRIGDERWRGKSVDLALDHGAKGWSWAARLPDLNVAGVTRMVKSIGSHGGYLTSRDLAILDTIKPAGRLSDILLKSEPGQSGPKLVARVDSVHFNAYRRSPGISDINGFVALAPSHGYVDIYNHNPFTVDFSLFPDPWVLDTASGRLYYTRSPGYVHLSSGLIRLGAGAMKASARVNLNMPANPSMRTWALEMGIRHMQLLDVHKYLPVTLSANLSTWLHRALQGGQAVESGLLIHGTIGKNLPVASKSYELFFKTKNATLDYDPHWPPIHDLAAIVYIGDWGVASDDARGMIYDSRVTDGHIHVPVIKDEPAESILIDAKIRGPLSDGIKLLTKTPVAGATGDFAKDWTGLGQMDGRFKLDIPTGPRKGQPAGVDVSVNLARDQIMMANYNLDVLGINGTFRYRSGAGLSSKAFEASVFNRAVHGNIQTTSHTGGKAVDVRLKGKVNVKDLYRWSGQTILSRASGIAAYSALLHIPVGAGKGRHSWIEAKSDLAGVKIDLPPPMSKSTGSTKALVYRQTFLQPGYRIDLSLGDRTRASLVTKKGIVRGGRLQFGTSPLGQVSYDKVRVRGNLEYVDYAQWEKVTRYLNSHSKVSLTSAAANTLDSIDVNIGNLKAFGMSLTHVHTHITRQKAAWNVQLKNSTIAGRIVVPDSVKRPLTVALDYLRYKSAKGKASGDPLAGVQPTQFLPVDFSTKQLELNGVDYGNWSFKFRPDKNGAMLDDLQAKVKGLSIQPDSEVAWNTGGAAVHSAFKGTIKIHDLARTLKDWGLASSIEGKDFVLQADVAWPGSPANVDLYTMQGMLKLNQGQGRFVQADAGSNALKLLGIFDFASLAKRFRLDFSDIVKTGFSFSGIKGSASIDNGLLNVVRPVEITGPSSTLKLGGSVNLKTGHLDSDMVITLPVARNLPWYAAYSAIAAGPLTGAGVWLAQKIFGNQINQMSSAKYKITGTIDKPDIDFVSIFNDQVRESTAKPPPLKAAPGAGGTTPKSTVGAPAK